MTAPQSDLMTEFEVLQHATAGSASPQKSANTSLLALLNRFWARLRRYG